MPNDQERPPNARPANRPCPRPAARRRRRRHSRGMSMIEVLLVVALMGLISAAVVTGVMKSGTNAKVGIATTGARQLHASAEQWSVTHGDGECPTVSRMMDDGLISETASTNDPWNKPYRIVCDGGKIRVYSSGPDRKDGNEDDIRMPAARVASGG
jgi:general secretion pathway protein G